MAKTVSKKTLSVIIAAAGYSVRMRAQTPKVLLTLAGKPVLTHSVETFSALDEVREIVVAAPAELAAKFRKLLRPYEKVSVVTGGGLRLESVARAAARLSKRAAFTAVHDGARPLVTAALIRRVLAKAVKTGAAVPALTPAETVKQADSKGRVRQTLDRSRLHLVQTPQIFEKNLFFKALAFAKKTKKEYTDDAAMVEALGHTVHVVKGDRRNIKITYPDDLKLAGILIG
jgi:2-C-methyl-D-erythritol 4-phosphate cytidylyltransferase